MIQLLLGWLTFARKNGEILSWTEILRRFEHCQPSLLASEGNVSRRSFDVYYLTIDTTLEVFQICTFFECYMTAMILPLPPSVVDLGDWIGESFSKENHHVLGVHRAFDLLSDGGEFLGFTMKSDSATKYRNARGGNRQSAHPSENPKQSTVLSMDILPNRLELTHNGRLLQVECLMVEVKSSTE
jgi:hypothetical protein